MSQINDAHPDSPRGGGGAGGFRQAAPYHYVPDPNSPEAHPKAPAGRATRSQRPTLGDQVNPFGMRDSAPRDYRKFFEESQPKALAAAHELLVTRIKNWVIENCLDKPRTAPAMTGGKEDVDVTVKDDGGNKFGDAPQSWWKRTAELGSYEIKTDEAKVIWKGPDFTFSATMYIWEQTGIGDDEFEGTGMEEGNLVALAFRALVFATVEKRKMRMGEWPINGSGTCLDALKLGPSPRKFA